MSLSSDNTVMTMPVTPAYQGGGYGNSMWGGDWASWIILFLIFGMFGWGTVSVAVLAVMVVPMALAFRAGLLAPTSTRALL